MSKELCPGLVSILFEILAASLFPNIFKFINLVENQI